MFYLLKEKEVNLEVRHEEKGGGQRVNSIYHSQNPHVAPME